MSKQAMIDEIEYESFFVDDGDVEGAVLSQDRVVEIINKHLEGKVIVPEEITESMVMAVADARLEYVFKPCCTTMTATRKVEIDYSAMLSAAKEEK